MSGAPLPLPVPGRLLVIDDVLDLDLCDDAVTVYERRPDWTTATVRDGSWLLDLFDDFRTGDPFLRRLLDPMLDTLAARNASEWRFDTLDLHWVQLLRYTSGQRHPRHADGAIDPTRRWLGIVVALTRPADYSGGEFVAAGHDPIRPPAGSAVFIPGHVPHHVEPVTGGLRYVLTAFACSRSQP